MALKEWLSALLLNDTAVQQRHLDIELDGAGLPAYALQAVHGAWAFTVLQGAVVPPLGR